MVVRRLAVAVAVTLALALRVDSPAQELSRISTPDRVSNWSAPPYWMPAAAPTPEEVSKEGLDWPISVEAIEAVPTPPLAFTGINPCRVADTRGNGFTGQYGPPQITPAGRTITIANQCGIPGTAQAVSFNFSAVNVPGAGFLVAYPAGGAFPASATMTYNQNTPNLSNAAVVPLGTGGAIIVVAGVVSIDLVIDVNGYYAPQTVVNTVNGLSGDITLAPGTDVSVTPGANTLTIGTNATSSSTANTIVRRDGAGGFTAITIALSGNLQLPASSNTIGQIMQSGSRLLHTFGTNNVFLGNNAGNFTLTGGNNTAVGVTALSGNTAGDHNTAVGFSALLNTTGSANTATGVAALDLNTTGSSNTAVGVDALGHNTTGSFNIAIGKDAGDSLTTGSFNIAIGNAGVAAEANTIRIGAGTQTRTFLAGVRGATTGAADGLTVLVDSNGQLGTISSSASVKREIADVGEASSPLLSLRPVSFLYRNDAVGIRQFGLIAEEVATVMPELVQFSPEGRAETVRYHFLGPLLLSELQKQQRRIEAQDEEIATLRKELKSLEARLTESTRN
jgi:endosialidase-like protein